MTILKKIASLLLSLAIVITVLPTAALASALDFGSEVSPIDMAHLHLPPVDMGERSDIHS